MSAVSAWIVREYFESLGYLVTQPCKYSVASKKRKPDELVDLIICNPAIKEHVIPEQLIWKTSDLNSIAGAVIGVSGWHTDRFYAATFAQAPELFRFAGDKALKFAAQRIGLKNPAKILCLPQLPASEKLKNDSIKTLREHGIDGVLSFRTLLLELVRSINTNNNYEKSDLLQIIRLLKNYGLLKDGQMDFFVKERKKR